MTLYERGWKCGCHVARYKHTSMIKLCDEHLAEYGEMSFDKIISLGGVIEVP